MKSRQNVISFPSPNDEATDHLSLILQDIAGNALSPAQLSALVTAAAGSLAAAASAAPAVSPPPAPPDDQLQFDRKEAARRLGYSPTTIDRLVERGLLRPNRATGRPRFSIKELERFIESGVAV